MARRQFKLQQRLAENAFGAVMDVPHPVVLRDRAASKMIQDFQEHWGVRPEAVVLPVVSPDGLFFSVEGLPGIYSGLLGDDFNPYGDFRKWIYEFASDGIDVYLLINSELSFFSIDALHIEDIAGSGSAHMCVNNPRAQEILGAVLGTAVDIAADTVRDTSGKLRGIVFDAVNLWPMGSDNERLHLTCFCSYCRKYFAKSSPSLLAQFQKHPNPWHLGLKDSGSGIAHIDDFTPQMSPEDVVAISTQNGYATTFGADPQKLLAMAEGLLSYIRIRHDLTVSAMQTVLAEAVHGLDFELSQVLLMEGSQYNWTAGLQLQLIDEQYLQAAASERVFDELWIDVSTPDVVPSHIPYRAYMSGRSRYFLDAFFELAANAVDPRMRSTTGIGRMPDKALRNLLRTRLRQVMAALSPGAASLATLPGPQPTESSSGRFGFVGVALDPDSGSKVIDSLPVAEGVGDLATDSHLMSTLRSLLEQQLLEQQE